MLVKGKRQASFEVPPKGWRIPTWREPPGGFIKRESFGGPIVSRPDVYKDILHIASLTAERDAARTICCAMCSLGGPSQHTLQLTEVPIVIGKPKRPQHEVLRSLRAALVDEGTDVLLRQFVDSAEQLLFALEMLGMWTRIAVREVRANLLMLTQSIAMSAAGDGARLTEVLAAEVASGIHSGGGQLANASAALALNWLARFLGMWIGLWREPRLPTFKANVMRSYGTNIQPYHSWLLQKTFSIATAGLVPSWSEARALLAAFDPEGEAGMLRNVAALAPIVDRISATLHEMQLWDARRI